MKKNIANLESRLAILEEVSIRAEAASKGLGILRDALAKAHEYGGSALGSFLLLEALDADELSGYCARVGGDAESKIKLLKAARAEEERRLDNFKTNLKTCWDISL